MLPVAVTHMSVFVCVYEIESLFHFLCYSLGPDLSLNVEMFRFILDLFIFLTNEINKNIIYLLLTS